MVWDAITLILSPVVWVMERIMAAYAGLTGSMGVSILLLSLTMVVLSTPLRRYARGIETRLAAKSAAVRAALSDLDPALKGEARFLATEAVYRKHGYHPIQSVGQGASFLALLPVLLSAIVLFSSGDMVAGASFLFIDDLSAPDGALGAINVLPFAMTGITLADARLRFADDRAARLKFYGIALVLLILVYGMPSALVLYWTGSNLVTMAMVHLASKGAPALPAGQVKEGGL